MTLLALLPEPFESVSTGWDKSNHLLAFAALALSGRRAFAASRAAGAFVPGALLAYGALIELLQTLVPNRSGEWGDFAADVVGVALGLLLAQALRKFTRG